MLATGGRDVVRVADPEGPCTHISYTLALLCSPYLGTLGPKHKPFLHLRSLGVKQETRSRSSSKRVVPA